MLEYLRSQKEEFLSNFRQNKRPYYLLIVFFTAAIAGTLIIIFQVWAIQVFTPPNFHLEKKSADFGIDPATGSPSKATSGKKSNKSSTDTANGTSGSSTPSSSCNSAIKGTSTSSTPIDEIENSLALVVTDAEGNYSNPGSEQPPGGVYPFPAIDFQQIYMGTRDGRIYIKFTLFGTIPCQQETSEGNRIMSVTSNLGIDNDGDTGDGDGWLGSEDHLQLNFKYEDNGDIWAAPWYRANYLGGGGEGDFETTGNGLLHTGNGGLGENHFIISYAASDLPDSFTPGKNLNFNFWSEAGSNLYSHFSYSHNKWIPWTVLGI